MIKNYHVFDDIIPKEEQMILNNYVKNNDIEWVQMENIIHQYGGNIETQKFPAKVHPKPNCKNEEINRTNCSTIFSSCSSTVGSIKSKGSCNY